MERKNGQKSSVKQAKNYNEPDKETIRNIITNYEQNEKMLVDQLYFTTKHGGTIGGFREDIWKQMFAQIVPKKFVIEQSVFIIDSEGRVSNEVDLAIFDETYTPYIFRYGKLKFLPIEAVAAVIECKSTSVKQKLLENWVKSIAALTTSRQSYTRTLTEIIVGSEKCSPTQTATRPLRILCCLTEKINNKRLRDVGTLFDFIIKAKDKHSGFEIETDTKKKNLQDWYLALNHASKEKPGDKHKGENLFNVELDHYQIKNKEGKLISLLTFNLQLNQLLMLINNPILFPHIAYAKMFVKFGKE